MITTKSKREIELMERAGAITFGAIEAVKQRIRPGASTKELDKVAYDFITAQGAVPSFLNYNGFKGSICASVNEVLVHGIPSAKKILHAGDIITIDCGAIYKGYHGDSAWTFPVGAVTPEAQALLDVTKASLFAGLATIRPGSTLGDLGAAISEYCTSRGYSLPTNYTGHGIGTSMHEDPAVPNYGIKGKGVILKEGMTIAVEPMVHIGKKETRTLSDDWTVISADHSLTAHFEHTIVVTGDGYKILTQAKEVVEH